MGKETKIRKENPKVPYSVAFVMVFPAAENLNRHLEDLPRANFNYVAERFDEKVNN